MPKTATHEAADLLRDNVDTVVTDWLNHLMSIPHTKTQKTLPAVEVKDGVVSLLLQLANVLEDPTHMREFEEGGSVWEHARVVGSLRKEQGYQVHEVIQDYFVLRSQLWDFFEKRLGPEQIDFYNLEDLVNTCIDNVLMTTMQTYYHAQTEELKRASQRDGLTLLYNHAYLHGALEEETKRSQRYGCPLSFLMLDLDDFKIYNDTYGHLAGDEVLKLLGEVLMESTRDVDVAARYGGDEFAIIAVETEKDRAMLMAKRISDSFKKHLRGRLGKKKLPTLSIGVAGFPVDAQTKHGVIEVADQALYRAKHDKGNKTVGA